MQTASVSYETTAIASDGGDDEGGESECVAGQKSGIEEEELVKITMSPVQVDAVSMEIQQEVTDSVSGE